MVKNVHWNTAQATCLKEQRATGEAGHTTLRRSQRVCGLRQAAIWRKVTARTGQLLGQEDTGKLRAAPCCRRDSKAGRYRLRDKEEDSAESEGQCIDATQAEKARQWSMPC